MDKNFLVNAYAVCEAASDGAMPLYYDISSDEICLYVKVMPCAADMANVNDLYTLKEVDERGVGYTYGNADNNISTKESTLPVSLENFVFSADGASVLGYVYKGHKNYYNNGSRSNYERDIFLPASGEARAAESVYSYSVYPIDGTSSEYKRVTKLAFECIEI